jgi:hypothetical protein
MNIIKRTLGVLAASALAAAGLAFTAPLANAESPCGYNGGDGYNGTGYGGFWDSRTPSSVCAGGTSSLLKIPNSRDYLTFDKDHITMCPDWTEAYGDGINEPGTCSDHSGWGTAISDIWSTSSSSSTGAANRTEDFGWYDTDGFWVPPGWDVAISNTGSNVDWGWKKYKHYGFHKVQGCWNCNTNIKVYPNAS